MASNELCLLTFILWLDILIFLVELYCIGKKWCPFLLLLKMMMMVLCYKETLQESAGKTGSRGREGRQEDYCSCENKLKRKEEKATYRNVGRVRALFDLWKVGSGASFLFPFAPLLASPSVTVVSPNLKLKGSKETRDRMKTRQRVLVLYGNGEGGWLLHLLAVRERSSAHFRERDRLRRCCRLCLIEVKDTHSFDLGESTVPVLLATSLPDDCP